MEGKERKGRLVTPHVLKAIILGILVGVAGIAVSPLRVTLGIEENAGLGLLFKLRGAIEPPPDAIVISIDKESSEVLGLPDNPDKWPRSLHARMTEIMAGEGASVVAFDVHFIEPRIPGDDTYFASAMKNAGNVVLVEPMKTKEVKLPGGGLNAGVHSIVRVVLPIDLFADAAAATAPFTLPRIPFKVNRYNTFEIGAGNSPAVPVVALQLFAADVYGDFVALMEKIRPDLAGRFAPSIDRVRRSGGVKDLVRDIREVFEGDPNLADRMLGELKCTDKFTGDAGKRGLIESLVKMYRGGNSRYINYFGPPGTVTTIPYHEALNIKDGMIGEEKIDLAGIAVFVGLSEVLLAERKDSFYTVFSRANGVFISGVEIAATAFSNLLADTPVKPAGLSFFMILVLAWGIALGAFCRISHIGVAALGTIGLSVLYIFSAKYQFEKNHAWYPIAVPLFFQAPLAFFGAVVWNYIDAKKERVNIQKAFEHYLPKDVVAQLARDVAHIRTGGQVVYGVCLFTDAQHYTTLSETMDPHELGKFMNRYYETMFRPVKRHGGFVSGVIGDSMLALWVSARSESKLKNSACFAAVDIEKELDLFDTSTEGANLKTRIGLHCGEILLGHVGALDHYEYTPMGDIVNTASRIEGLNKHLGTSLLVSDEVVENANGFLTRDLGRFKLKGKANPVGVYELVCRVEEADEKVREACAIFAEALEAFGNGSFDEAMEKFKRSGEILGEDRPSRIYEELCERYRENPPGDGWDGVVHMEKK